MTSEEAEGHITAAPYFATLDSEPSRRFARAYRSRFGEDSPITAGAEAAYFRAPGGRRRARGRLRDAGPRRRAQGRAVRGAQGRVAIDGDTQHTSLWPRIARVNARREFEIIYAARARGRCRTW